MHYIGRETISGPSELGVHPPLQHLSQITLGL
jgi:hypothetical protein